MDDAAAIRIINEAIPDAIAIYRFGSSVTGETHPGSDVDLAVLAPRPLPPLERFDLQERLASALGRSVDLLDLRSATTVMRMQVVSKGRLLATGDAAETGRFEDYVFSSYARLNEERKEILEQVLREQTVYGR